MYPMEARKNFSEALFRCNHSENSGRFVRHFFFLFSKKPVLSSDESFFVQHASWSPLPVLNYVYFTICFRYWKAILKIFTHYFTIAAQTKSTCSAPFTFNSDAMASTVLPVVKMSSTRRIRQYFICPGFANAKAPPGFSAARRD